MKQVEKSAAHSAGVAYRNERTLHKTLGFIEKYQSIEILRRSFRCVGV